MRGLYNKYHIAKVDGSTDPDAQYFILRIDSDLHARVALRAYADSIREENPILAADLDIWLAEQIKNGGVSDE